MYSYSIVIVEITHIVQWVKDEDKDENEDGDKDKDDDKDKDRDKSMYGKTCHCILLVKKKKQS